MKLLIALYFYMLATIQLGLLLGVYHYFRSQSLIKPSPFWMRSLIVSILALIVFGTGIVGIENIEKPEFNFTIANSLFYIAAIFQLLFCRSLNESISKSIKQIDVYKNKIENKISKLSDENNTLTLEINKLNSQLFSSGSASEEMGHKIQELTSNLTDLTEKYSKLSVDHSVLLATIQKAEEKSEKINEEIKILQQELTNISE
jgi:outer membrane murein-binding lipoprotein Lpp